MQTNTTFQKIIRKPHGNQTKLKDKANKPKRIITKKGG